MNAARPLRRIIVERSGGDALDRKRLEAPASGPLVDRPNVFEQPDVHANR